MEIPGNNGSKNQTDKKESSDECYGYVRPQANLKPKGKS